MSTLSQDIDDLYCLYEDIKREVKTNHKDFYQRWKAGGYLIDTDIISSYPPLEKLLYLLDEDEEDDDED